jgi:acyl-CoA thioesterase II
VKPPAPGAPGASVDDVLQALDLDRQEAGHWRGSCVPAEGGVVFGGQLIGQAIVAAAKEAADKRVSSVHTTFARVGRPDRAVAFDIDQLHEGRSFASLSITARQGDRQLARSLVLLDGGDEDVLRHADAAPAVKPLADAVRQQALLHGWDQRYAGDVDLFDPAAVGPPELGMWSRFRTERREPALAQALLGWASVGSFIGTAMRPHSGVGLVMAHRELSTGVLSHTLSFHQEFTAGEWLLFLLRSPFAGAGRAFGTGQVFTEDGRLVASCAQESMIRQMAAVGGSAL